MAGKNRNHERSVWKKIRRGGKEGRRREEKTSMFEGSFVIELKIEYRVDRNDRGTISSEAQTLAALNKT